jgi:hypothetical protein
MGERVGRILLWVTNGPLLDRVVKFSMSHGVIRDETWKGGIERIPMDHVKKLLVRNCAIRSKQVFPADSGWQDLGKVVIDSIHNKGREDHSFIPETRIKGPLKVGKRWQIGIWSGCNFKVTLRFLGVGRFRSEDDIGVITSRRSHGVECHIILVWVERSICYRSRLLGSLNFWGRSECNDCF